MIRREGIDSDGTRVWLLIDQIEHARLAGTLAQHWQLGQILPERVRAEWLQAVLHHDDGWAEWDAQPGVDPRNARPFNFNEMPTAESTAIWRHSIAAAAACGPLAEYAVAGHFRALLLRFDSWRKADATARQAGEQFLQFADATLATALAAWQSPAKGLTLHVAERALHLLQFFDALSLWFCCEPRTMPQSFTPPRLGPVTFDPLCGSARIADQPATVAVTPWPFDCNSLDLCVAARAIPVLPYTCARLDQNLRLALPRLHWRLAPK